MLEENLTKSVRGARLVTDHLGRKCVNIKSEAGLPNEQFPIPTTKDFEGKKDQKKSMTT